MSCLLTNIGRLVGISESSRFLRGKEMDCIDMLDNAWLLIENEKIADWGKMGGQLPSECEILDLKGGWVFPSFCDSHTHIVFAGSREREFEDKIKGLSYEEIAARGGGILNSAKRLRATSENQLFSQAMERIDEIISKGTGAIEIKSGYGLTTVSEMKMLRVIRMIKESTPLLVKSTFLGAHAIPEEYRNDRDGYVELICREMLPEVAKEGLADFVDVFCDRGFFTIDNTRKIIDRAGELGIKAKIHADELALTGGTRVAVEKKAVSVDHLEQIGEDEIDVLSGSNTVPTALPGASFFSNLPFAPVRRMIDSGLGVALASDFNPGSSPSGDMKFIAALGCIKMRMTPIEAVNAVTINGAYAMNVQNHAGTISRGKIANLFVTRPLSSLAELPYYYTTPLIRQTILRGRLIP